MITYFVMFMPCYARIHILNLDLVVIMTNREMVAYCSFKIQYERPRWSSFKNIS